jgi:putative oxidoreductase
MSRGRTRRGRFDKSDIETRRGVTQPGMTDSDARAFDPIEWAVRLGVALVYVGIGCEKVFPSRDSYWVKIFTEIGLGQWFMYLTGTIQIMGGLLMITPRTALFGATLLAGTMIGAILTHLFLLNTGFGGAVIPAAFLGLIGAAVRLRFTDRTGAQPLDLR